MTKVINTAAALLAGTALALSASAASAASMAKAGMDKRVADLEREVTLLKNQMKSAMMAKAAPDKNIVSGNSHVKVTIYGQVNKAVRLSSSGGDTQFDVVDNDGSSSRIGIRAVGQIDKNISIVGWHELEWQYNRRSHIDAARGGARADGTSLRLRARHVDLSISHKGAGSVHIGQGSIAGDAADLISLGGVGHVFGTAGHAADGTTASRGDERGISRGWRTFKFFGARENRIMYVTPSIMGASVRLSYSQNDSFSAGLRYGGAPMGKALRVMFWAGYRQDPNDHVGGSGNTDTSWGLSAGVAHADSGLSVSGNYSAQQTKGSAARPTAWFAEIGWAGKLIAAGKTQLAVGYGKFNDDVHLDSQQIWGAVNQNVDAAAADVYAGLAMDSGDAANAAGDASEERDDVYIFIAGARVKF